MPPVNAKPVPPILLERSYPLSDLPLARLLPSGAYSQRGLHHGFTALDRLCVYLETNAHNGALVLLEETAVQAVALVFEGHLVSANSLKNDESVWGDAALLVLTQGFMGAGVLEVLSLEHDLVHALSGVQDKAWKVQGGEGFTGVRMSGHGFATLHFDGVALGRVPLGSKESGAFPAPLRPARLNLPRIVGAWASERYIFTLRGRDSVNPITDQYNRARATHGKPNVEVLAQLGRGKTPLEVAQTLERDVAGLEGIIEAFLREGLLTQRSDPST